MLLDFIQNGSRAQHLLYHPWPDLIDSDLHPGAFASVAAGHGPLLAAKTVALVADDVFLQRESLRRSVVHVLERNLELVHNVLALVVVSSLFAQTSGKKARSIASKDGVVALQLQ